MDATFPESYLRVSEDALNAKASLQKGIWPTCVLDNTGLRIFVEEPEFEHGEVLAAPVDFVLADLPYNIKRA